VNNDLAARALRDKCTKGDTLRMVSHLDDLQEICMGDPRHLLLEAEEVHGGSTTAHSGLQEVQDHQQRSSEEFYSLLRAAIKGAKGISRLGLLINDQTVPKIMSKMPYTDWKEWATKRPDWMQQDLTSTFERFVERKWQDALNVAAAEPESWNAGREKSSPSGGTQDKAAHVDKGALRVTGAVNEIEQKPPPGLTPHHGTFPSEGSVGRGT
jgi:hypothetical protein